MRKTKDDLAGFYLVSEDLGILSGPYPTSTDALNALPVVASNFDCEANGVIVMRAVSVVRARKTIWEEPVSDQTRRANLARGEVISRLCALVSEVGEKVYRHEVPHDCFCLGRDFETVDDVVIRYIEDATHARMKNEGDL